MDKTRFSRPLDLKMVQITDGFWHAARETVRTQVIPYQWEALNDRVPGAEPSWCMHNFRAAARLWLSLMNEHDLAAEYFFALPHI